jgi:hypothetical protein
LDNTLAIRTRELIEKEAERLNFDKIEFLQRLTQILLKTKVLYLLKTANSLGCARTSVNNLLKATQQLNFQFKNADSGTQERLSIMIYRESDYLGYDNIKEFRNLGTFADYKLSPLVDLLTALDTELASISPLKHQEWKEYLCTELVKLHDDLSDEKLKNIGTGTNINRPLYYDFISNLSNSEGLGTVSERPIRQAIKTEAKIKK